MKRLLCLLLTAAMLSGLIPAFAETQETQPVPLPAVGDVVEGFEVKEIRDFPLVGGTAVLFEHQKTGAGLTYIANEDTNRVFTLAFLTRPIDNTGLPHVFEHSTLDGSDKWPSKALWFNVTYQTYNTYMNASTGSHMTYYPVASLSEAQLLKYTDYYTDACLHPMVLTDESIYREEAWRYRMASMEDDLTIEGTVYSEMLGANTLARAASFNANKTAFPGSVVGLDQGGLPEAIPDMTWESLKNYHALYYHPSNCMAYLYGQLNDYTAFLKILNDAFSDYDKQEFAFEDKDYTPLTESVEVSFAFPTAADSDPKNQSMIYYTFLCPGLKADLDEEMVLNTMTDVLVSPSSPLSQALRKVLPSASFATYISTDAPDDAIVFIAQNVNPEDAAVFRSTVDSVLADIAAGGFDQETVDSVMASLAMDIKMIPDGTSVGVDIIPSIAYSYASCGDPFNYMDYVESLMLMSKWNQEGLYQKAVQDWLCADGVVTALVTTYPQPGLKEEQDAATAEKLAALKASMSEEELQAIIDATNAVEPEEDTSAMVASLQAVTVESLPEEVRTYNISDETDDSGVRHIDAGAGVEGVGKVSLFLDAKGLPQDALHYFKLFTDLVGKLDTDKHTKDELDILIARYLYGFEFRPSIMQNEEEGYITWLRLGWNALDEDLAAGYDLISELVWGTQFDNVERLTEQIAAVKTMLRSTINGSAQSVVIYRSLGAMLPIDRYYSYMNYIEYYQFLEQVEALIAENPQAVIDQLKAVQSYFHNRTGAIAAFAGSEDSIAVNRPLADAFFAGLDAQPITHVTYDLPAPAAREALIIDSAVQFNGLVSSYEGLGLDGFDASLNAISSLVSDQFLIPLLRDQYGVYTPLAGAFMDDGFYLLTYRDPNIRETYQVYESLADLIENMELDQDTLNGYILSTYSGLANSAGELSGAVDAIVNLLSGRPQDINLQYMRQLKALTPDGVKHAAEIYRKLAESGIRCTAGSAAAINANADLYDAILNPFNAKDTSQVSFEDVTEDSEHYASVRFAFENGLMAPAGDTAFGVENDATVGDLMGGLYTLLGGAPNAQEEARAFLAGYGLVDPELDLATPLNEQFAVDLLQGAFGQPVISTETPDLVMTRGSLADLLQMLASALTQQQ